MYILDTNTISELRKAKMVRGDQRVMAWAATVEAEDQYLSAITIHEIEVGVLLAERKDPRKGAILRNWMTHYIQRNFRDRILQIDANIALRSAQLQVQRSRSLSDMLISATAYVHGLTVVTRNVRDFSDTGVDVINPWNWGEELS
jgi:predicted nucleic acid-binding protein